MTCPIFRSWPPRVDDTPPRPRRSSFRPGPLDANARVTVGMSSIRSLSCRGSSRRGNSMLLNSRRRSKTDMGAITTSCSARKHYHGLRFQQRHSGVNGGASIHPKSRAISSTSDTGLSSVAATSRMLRLNISWDRSVFKSSAVQTLFMPNSFHDACPAIWVSSSRLIASSMASVSWPLLIARMRSKQA